MDCLILGKVWPEPASTAAGRRIEDLVAALSAPGWSVHFASAAQRGCHALDLEAMGVATQQIAVNDPAFDAWIAGKAPDVVVFDRFMTEEQFGWRVAAHCPEALRVLETSDLHCLRLARQQSLETGAPPDLKNETALREIASIYRSDLSLLISDFEMELLRREFALPEELIAYWPFAVRLPEAVAGFAQRAHCHMIGSFLHPPNFDAVGWCVEAIWPRVRKALPEVELHLYGSYGERFADRFHAPEDGVHFKGRAGDAIATMSCYRLNLAPLRYGAGLKGKVFDGFQSGTPTVMTPIAAEGIATSEDWMQAEPDAFADEVIRLYRDPRIWELRQSQAHALCRERFDPGFWLARLPEIIENGRQNKDVRRQRNFIGRMLRHHNHRSTEFMSRWIEAKNR